MSADGGVLDAAPTTHERGAESSGEFPSGSWRVFRITEHGEAAHILVATVAKGVRRKLRVPKKYKSQDERARFAKSAALELAKEYANETATAIVTKTDANDSAITFNDFATLWTSGELTKLYPGHVKAKRSIDGDVQRLKFMMPLIGDVPVRDFNVQHAERVLASIPKKRSSATMRHYGQTIHRVLKLAVYPGKVISHHPLPDGFLPTIGPRRAMSFLYPSEDASLMACTSIPLQRRILYGVLAREGMRFGEAVGLEWSDIDLETGVVVLDRTKTNEPRSWKLGDDVVSALDSYRKTLSKKGALGNVFLDEVGGAFVGKKLSSVFRKDLQLAGIKRPQLFERSKERIAIRVHDLRSSFTTLALAHGRTETWVVDRAGWKSSAMIARYRRQARTASELNLGWFHPLHVSIPEFASKVDTAKPKPTAPTCSENCSEPGTGDLGPDCATSISPTFSAERRGFEPLVPSRAHLISKRP